jgi:N-acetylglucosaminyl-diphospho-decaprenol L-rhamnosyltransferase
MLPDLTIVIVSWNVAPLLRNCLQSILDSPHAHVDQEGLLSIADYSLQVCVVDNASCDGSVEMVQREFPWVQLIASAQNLGFTAGNNLALGRYRGRHVLLLNPDTRVVDDALVQLLGALEARPAVGVVGPQLRYPDGSLQPSRRRFPTLMTALMESTLLEQWFPHNRWAQSYRMADTPDDLFQQVDWVTGACMLVRGEVLERVGLLDERFFMYSEELDWCRRIVDDDWQVLYWPQAVVVHYEGQSSDQVIAARHIRFETSKILYFRKHHGPWQAMLLRAFLLATYLFRLNEEAAKYLVGHKRDVRRQRIIAYAEVLRSGLRSSAGRA